MWAKGGGGCLKSGKSCGRTYWRALAILTWSYHLSLHSGHKYHTGIQRPQGPLDPSNFGGVAPRSKPEGWFKTESRVWLQTMPLFTNSRPAVLQGDDYIIIPPCEYCCGLKRLTMRIISPLSIFVRASAICAATLGISYRMLAEEEGRQNTVGAKLDPDRDWSCKKFIKFEPWSAGSLQYSTLVRRVFFLTIWSPGNLRHTISQKTMMAIQYCRCRMPMLLRQGSRCRHRGDHRAASSSSPLSLVPLLHFAAQTFVILSGIYYE